MPEMATAEEGSSGAGAEPASRPRASAAAGTHGGAESTAGNSAGMMAAVIPPPSSNISAGGASAGHSGAAAVSGAAGTGSEQSGGTEPSEASAKTSGMYAVERYTSGFSSTGFGGGTIYYPGDGKPPFGSVAILPGGSATQSSIAAWGPFLASHGIVTMTIDTLQPLDSPALRADQVIAALAALAQENSRAGSALNGKLDTSRQCVSGWSMGGGGALIAASKKPNLRCTVALAAWQPMGGADNNVPALMFEGSADQLAGGMSETFYTQMPQSTPKMLIEVSGAGSDVANDPGNSSGMIGLYGLSWFKVYLDGDERYKKFLLAPAPGASKFMTNVK